MKLERIVRGPVGVVVGCLQPATLNRIVQSDAPDVLITAALEELLSRSIRRGLKVAA